MDEHRVCLSETVWGGWDLSDGTFIETSHSSDDDAVSVALSVCTSKWVAGTHRILVANSLRAAIYDVSVETESVELS